MICCLYSSWKETPSKFQVWLVTQSESHSPSESPTTQFSVSLPADGNGAVRTPTCPYNTVGSETPEPAPSATSGDGTANPRALPRPDGQPETGEEIELTPRWKWWLQVPASPKTGPRPVAQSTRRPACPCFAGQREPSPILRAPR